MMQNQLPDHSQFVTAREHFRKLVTSFLEDPTRVRPRLSLTECIGFRLSNFPEGIRPELLTSYCDALKEARELLPSRSSTLSPQSCKFAQSWLTVAESFLNAALSAIRSDFAAVPQLNTSLTLLDSTTDASAKYEAARDRVRAARSSPSALAEAAADVWLLYSTDMFAEISKSMDIFPNPPTELAQRSEVEGVLELYFNLFGRRLNDVRFLEWKRNKSHLEPLMEEIKAAGESGADLSGKDEGALNLLFREGVMFAFTDSAGRPRGKLTREGLEYLSIKEAATSSS